MGMFPDAMSWGEDHVIEKSAFSIQFLCSIEDFVHFCIPIAVTDTLEFYTLLFLSS